MPFPVKVCRFSNGELIAKSIKMSNRVSCNTYLSIGWGDSYQGIMPRKKLLYVLKSDPVLWSRNFLFPLRLRLRLSKSFSSGSCSGSRAGSGYDISFDLPFITDFILKKWNFHVFMKEYQPNSHAGFYTKWILIFIYYLSWPGAGAGSRSRNFDISAPAPAPAKSSGSMRLRLRLHNTVENCGNNQGKAVNLFYFHVN